MKSKFISGFSKLSKKEKLDWLAEQFHGGVEDTVDTFSRFWHQDPELQKIIDGFSENTISNFYMPYGVAPNFVINDKVYTIPMVIEESSVVAAASSAAKYWMNRGGFKATILSTTKIGQVHFAWSGSFSKLQQYFLDLKQQLLKDAKLLTLNMEKRGGGVLDIELMDMTQFEADYYQLKVKFETCDSMGANFINSVLESFGHTLKAFFSQHPSFDESESDVEIIMAILSNYTPDCLVRASVECDVEEMECPGVMDAVTFANKFAQAVRIAHIDPYRAATHNKGIFNGVDAVVLATGNDFRAIEACGHTYAARDGQYRSLSYCKIENGRFKFWLDLPLAIGTVGGLTKLHPLAQKSLELLGHPSAKTLMEIIGVTGLAQNFAAVKSLITTGIQKGHMKMHLTNILNHLNASMEEIELSQAYFKDKVISHTSVNAFLKKIRQKEDSQGDPN